VLNRKSMKRAGAAIAMCLSAFSCDKGGVSCANADYSECGSPLPAQQPSGEPWPTFDEALAEVLQCRRNAGDVLRGECADGKQFITDAGGFGGDTRFYLNGRLVGISLYSDVGGELCQCPFSSFQGTLLTVSCDRPMSEPLCGSTRPAEFQPSFSRATAGCRCDDPD
jgi:hypothetical protein